MALSGPKMDLIVSWELKSLGGSFLAQVVHSVAYTLYVHESNSKVLFDLY